jgi:hypothetical protein
MLSDFMLAAFAAQEVIVASLLMLVSLSPLVTFHRRAYHFPLPLFRHAIDRFST